MIMKNKGTIEDDVKRLLNEMRQMYFITNQHLILYARDSFVDWNTNDGIKIFDQKAKKIISLLNKL